MKGSKLVRTQGRLAILTVVAVVSWFGTAKAAILFSEDFDDITVTGNNITTATAGNSFTTTSTTSATSTAIVRVDSSNTFGAGTSNQYLEMSDSNTSGGITLRRQSIAGIASGGVAQFSFDFVDPAGVVAAATDDTLVFTLDDGAGASTSMSLRLLNNPGVHSLVLYNPAVYGDVYIDVAPQYTEDAKHSVAVALNFGASPVTYGVGLLGGQKFDVWFDGQLVRDDEGIFNVAATKASRIIISTSSGATAAFNLDNVVLSSDISIVPEPHCVALVAIGFFIGASRRRRRNS